VIVRSRATVIPRSVLILVLAIGAFAAIAMLALLPLDPVRSAESPDGAFMAVATRPFLYALVPMMPGQSGDAPGRITIYRKDGRSCGSAPVDMVWMIQDLRWELSKAPREVSLTAVAVWNLDACSVEVYER
jgi:hypothetical protein